MHTYLKMEGQHCRRILVCSQCGNEAPCPEQEPWSERDILQGLRFELMRIADGLGKISSALGK